MLRKKEGMLTTRMVLFTIFTNLSGLFISPQFSELPQLMQPIPWFGELVNKDLMDKYYFENSFVSVSFGLCSGFCLVSALGR